MLPGATHDLTAARHRDIIDKRAAADIATWADKAYQGAGGTVTTPFKGRHLPDARREVNRAHAKIRAKGERAIAVLKTWKMLVKVRCDPGYTTTILQAITVLQQVEDRRSCGWKRFTETLPVNDSLWLRGGVQNITDTVKNLAHGLVPTALSEPVYEVPDVRDTASRTQGSGAPSSSFCKY